MPLRGIDISNHQGVIDFDKARSSGLAEFVIAKCTEGIDFRDGFFDRNWIEARRVGAVRGAYHFARPSLGNAAKDEAEFFLRSLQPLLGSDLLALDYEDDWSGDVPAWCLAWLERLRSEVGFRPLIYLNLSLIRAHDWSAVIAGGYGLWLADYDGDEDFVPLTPWPVVAIKQWTSDGQVPGVVGRCDRDAFYGSREQLLRYGKETQMASPLRIGQSADLSLRQGEVGLISGIWRYASGDRSVTRKVVGYAPGRTLYEFHPPVDPDADPTEDLSAEPARFVIDVTL